MKRADEIETLLNIDVIPMSTKSITDKLSETFFPSYVTCKLSEVKSRSLSGIMLNCIYLIDTIWIVFIARCLYLNKFELCTIIKEIFHFMCI